MLTVHVFRCSDEAALCGYTCDRTGANLPANLPAGEWLYFTTLEIAPGQDRVGVDCAALLRDVQSHGFHLARSGVRLSPKGEAIPAPTGSSEGWT